MNNRNSSQKMPLYSTFSGFMFLIIFVLLFLSSLGTQMIAGEQVNVNESLVNLGGESFLEYSSRLSNSTSETELFNEGLLQFGKGDIEREYYTLPTIDIKTSNFLLKLKADSLFSELNFYADSLRLFEQLNANLNQGQLSVIKNFFKSKKEKTNLLYRVRNLSRLSDLVSDQKGRLLGNSLDIYQKLIYTDDNFYAIVQTKKSTGEINFYEFYSASIVYKTENFKFILGDFTPTIGYGSVFWTAFTPTKGSDVISPTLRLAKGVSPNTSAINFTKFRGAFVEVSLPDPISFFIDNPEKQEKQDNLKLRLWVADNKKTATLNVAGEVTGIDISPKYRTESEILKKDNLDETNFTLNLELQKSSQVYGLLWTKFKYDKEFNPKSSLIFAHRQINLFSYYDLTNYGNFTLGKELVFDTENNFSFKIASQTSVEKITWSNQIRYSTPNLRSMYGYNFGEMGNITNQLSLYNAFEIKYSPTLRLYQYFEVYSSLAKYNNLTGIQKGIDLFLESEYQATKATKLVSRIKYESKTESTNLEDLNQRVSYNKSRLELRLESQSVVSNNLKLRLRYEKNFINFSHYFPSEQGSLLFSELQFIATENIQINTRYTFFNTNSFQSAIWQYEYAMTGYTTTSALYGKGSRFFCVVNWKLIDLMKLNIRYSSTLFNNKDNTGSGILLIDDNNDGKFLIQLEYQL